MDYRYGTDTKNSVSVLKQCRYRKRGSSRPVIRNALRRFHCTVNPDGDIRTKAIRQTHWCIFIDKVLCRICRPTLASCCYVTAYAKTHQSLYCIVSRVNELETIDLANKLSLLSSFSLFLRRENICAIKPLVNCNIDTLLRSAVNNVHFLSYQSVIFMHPIKRKSQ